MSYPYAKAPALEDIQMIRQTCSKCPHLEHIQKTNGSIYTPKQELWSEIKENRYYNKKCIVLHIFLWYNCIVIHKGL